MNWFAITDTTALNITNAALGLAVLTILIVIGVQAVREARTHWRR